VSTAKPELPVNSTGLLQNTQALVLLLERQVVTARQTRDVLRVIYPWLPLAELAEDFPVPVLDDEELDYEPMDPSQDYEMEVDSE